jgi:hypothetical protein
MKRLRTKIVMAIAAAGVVAAVTGSASAQRVCVDIVIDVNGQGTAQHICLPE